MSRIYSGGKAENRYRPTDKSQRFAPVQAVSSDLQVAGYKRAVEQDARTMGEELNRQQQADNTALRAKQVAEEAGLRVGHSREKAELQMDQTYETKTFDLMMLNEKLNMSLERNHQQLSNQVNNAKFAAVKGSINSLLGFAGSVVKYGVAMDKIQKEEAIEAEKEALNNDLWSSFVGDDSGGISVSSDVQENSDVRNDITTANAQAQLGVADDLVQSSNPAEAHAGLRMSQSTIFNQLGAVRGRVYDARAQYPIVFQQAVDAGLIRPTAEGGAGDVKRFNKRFLEATGLLSSGMDRATIAEKVLIPSLGYAGNAMAGIDASYRKGIIATNQVEASSRITSLAISSTPGSVVADFEAAQLETAQTQMGFHNGGKVNGRTTAYTLGKFLSALKAEGNTTAINVLAQHAANPATPNIKLGDKYADLFTAARNGSLTTTLQRNDTRSLEARVRTNELQSAYLADPTEENRNRYLAHLERPGASVQDLKNANSIRNPSADKSNGPALTQLWRENESKGYLLSKEELEEAKLNGLDSDTYSYWKSRTREAVLKETVDPATTGLMAKIRTALKATAGKSTKLDPNAEQAVNTRAQAAHTQIVERLNQRAVVDASLREDPTRLAALVESTTADVLSAPEFQTTWNERTGGVRFGGPMLNNAVPKNARGQDDFSGFDVKDLFDANGIPRIQMNSTKDQFLDKAELEAAADIIISGGSASTVDGTVRAIADGLNMDTRSFVDAQLQAAGIGGLSEYRNLKETGSNYETPPASNIPTREELQELYPPQNTSYGGSAPNTPSGNGKARTIQVGRQLLDEGYVIWQHPNFDADRGYVADGSARVGQHSHNSPHYHGEALDFPIGDNGEAKLDRLYRLAMQNKEKWGISQIFWKVPGHYHHLHLTFAP